jgi:hypothetical protein
MKSRIYTQRLIFLRKNGRFKPKARCFGRGHAQLLMTLRIICLFPGQTAPDYYTWGRPGQFQSAKASEICRSLIGMIHAQVHQDAARKRFNCKIFARNI